MRRTVFDLELSTDETDPIVYIDQRGSYGESAQRLKLHVDQIDAVVAWLREAKGLLEARGELG